MPRYHGAHTRRIINALNKLAQGATPTLLITPRQMDNAIMATVHAYAQMRDSEDAEKAEQPALLPADPSEVEYP